MKVGMCVLAGLLLSVSGAQAVTVLIDTFDTGLEGWTATDWMGTPNAAVAAGGGLLNMSGDGGLLTMGQFQANAGDLGVGVGSPADYINDYANPLASVRFSFYVDPANAGAPAALELYFTTTTGGAFDPWTYSLTTAVSQGAGWYYLAANFYASDVGDPDGSGNGWFNPTLGLYDQASLLAALTEVEDIGLLVTFGQEDGLDQDIAMGYFALDDEFYVPEPGTWAALGFAFVSLGITFRKRLSDKVKELRG